MAGDCGLLAVDVNDRWWLGVMVGGNRLQLWMGIMGSNWVQIVARDWVFLWWWKSKVVGFFYEGGRGRWLSFG